MALVSSYDGFIFDFGGVLVHHQTDADQAKMARIASMPVESFAEGYWAKRLEYDKGLLTAHEYWYDVGKSSGTVLPADVMDKLSEVDAKSWMHFDQVMWDWIVQLRAAGKRVALLSNMPLEIGLELKSRPDRVGHFDHVTLSYELKAAKPEPAIYEECLEGIGTAADKTIFFDDRIANVQGAEMLGMHAIEFLNRDDVLLRMTA
jgi:putative hydrolase of the HAD superfamily